MPGAAATPGGAGRLVAPAGRVLVEHGQRSGHRVRDCVQVRQCLGQGVARGRGECAVRAARRREDRSRFLLAVSGGDGHHTVLSWAELDADFGGAPVLLAARLDGADLDGAGAQRVVPSDRCGARYVSAVTHVWFGALSPPSPGR
ncbi:hypothetical protein GCM10010347_20830 [Streptomyces cirratus]|uniref:Molybdopterin-dependent oxidoreductase n=1 Tax=Streptomyces cirratus TaxID=68187 RepID=A0ABQ3EUI6_9ACTN|nr:molybdopterin-dependent oxidoreductase [Streptomyces cirratus]GHB50959.1 hypothetical protein GCM10010347_20830 [Streptomyces cirratus]